MKRKVIQIANSTHLVSLPRKWALANNIVKGQEVDVVEEGDSVIISTERKPKPSSITLSFQEFDEKVLKWTISSAYKSGYDEIEVVFNDLRTIPVIEEIITTFLIGFVVIEQSDNRCVLRAVTKIAKTEFDSTLRRAFRIALTMARGMETIFREKKDYSSLKNLIALERTNNQLVNFCERMINKFGAPDQKKTAQMYLIPWNLEKVCDIYKYICRHLSRIDDHPKLSNETIRLFEEINKFFEGYVQLFYSFKMQEIVSLSDKRNSLNGQIESIMRSRAKKDAMILCYLHELVEKVTDFSGIIISVNILDKV